MVRRAEEKDAKKQAGRYTSGDMQPYGALIFFLMYCSVISMWVYIV